MPKLASIIDNCSETSMRYPKFIGQGYDSCSIMSEKENGVQSMLRKKHNMALYFHFASHKLNLVVNYLSLVPEICFKTYVSGLFLLNVYRKLVLEKKNFKR